MEHQETGCLCFATGREKPAGRSKRLVLLVLAVAVAVVLAIALLTGGDRSTATLHDFGVGRPNPQLQAL